MQMIKATAFPVRYLFVLLFIFSACAVFSLVVNPALNGISDVRIWADTKTYIDFAQAYENPENLVTVGANYFGPFYILKLTNFNYALIFACNLALLLLSLKAASSNFQLNKNLFYFLMLINPVTILSVVLLNKEILGLASVCFLLKYLSSRNAFYLALAIILSILTRWQHSFVIIFFVFFFNKFTTQGTKRSFTAIFGLTLLVSLFFPLLVANFPVFSETNVELLETQKDQVFGLLNIFNSLQNNYLYFFVVLPKTLFNLVGNLSQIFLYAFNFQSFEPINFYNIGLLGHQYWMGLTLAFIIFRRKLILDKQLLFFLVYCVFFSLNYFIQYRYFYPISVILAVMISRKRS
jgi:hypothetical protein